MLDILENTKSAFKNFDNLFSKVFSLVKMEECEPATQTQLLEILCLAIETKPVKAKNFLGGYLQLIIEKMVELQEDVDDDWTNPKSHEAVDAEDPEIKDFLLLVDRALAAMQDKSLLVISQFTQEYFKADDWRKVAVIIHILAQCGEYYDIDPVCEITQLVLQGYSHPNAKVRFAVLQLVGQYSDDHAGAFQDRLAGPIL